MSLINLVPVGPDGKPLPPKDSSEDTPAAKPTTNNATAQPDSQTVVAPQLKITPVADSKAAPAAKPATAATAATATPPAPATDKVELTPFKVNDYFRQGKKSRWTNFDILTKPPENFDYTEVDDASLLAWADELAKNAQGLSNDDVAKTFDKINREMARRAGAGDWKANNWLYKIFKSIDENTHSTGFQLSEWWKPIGRWLTNQTNPADPSWAGSPVPPSHQRAIDAEAAKKAGAPAPAGAGPRGTVDASEQGVEFNVQTAEPLLSLIRGGESNHNYDAANGGEFINDYEKGNYSQKTLGDWKIAQVQHDIWLKWKRGGGQGPEPPKGAFAIGAYQMTQNFLLDAAVAAGVQDDIVMTPENQSKLVLAYIQNRMPKVYDYINGTSNDRDGAVNDLARIWAALKNTSGTGAYDKDKAGNKGTVSQDAVATALDNLRAGSANLVAANRAGQPGTGDGKTKPGSGGSNRDVLRAGIVPGFMEAIDAIGSGLRGLGDKLFEDNPELEQRFMNLIHGEENRKDPKEINPWAAAVMGMVNPDKASQIIQQRHAEVLKSFNDRMSKIAQYKEALLEKQYQQQIAKQNWKAAAETTIEMQKIAAQTAMFTAENASIEHERTRQATRENSLAKIQAQKDMILLRAQAKVSESGDWSAEDTKLFNQIWKSIASLDDAGLAVYSSADEIFNQVMTQFIKLRAAQNRPLKAAEDGKVDAGTGADGVDDKAAGAKAAMTGRGPMQ